MDSFKNSKYIFYGDEMGSFERMAIIFQDFFYQHFVCFDNKIFADIFGDILYEKVKSQI